MTLRLATLTSALALLQFPYTQPINHVELKRAQPENGLVICRLQFASSDMSQSGSGWATDYPASDRNLSIRLTELTTTRVATTARGDPVHRVVDASSDALFTCPLLLAVDVGYLRLDEDEVAALQGWFARGGFLWADDFWGSDELRNFLAQVRRVLPEGTHGVLTPEHPLFHFHHQVTELPQVPSMEHWRRTGGQTSEYGTDSAVPTARGVFDERGHLQVLLTHNTDLSDVWQREADDPDFFRTFGVVGYGFGINVILYAFSH